eukprot:s3653_g2.t1
MAAVYPLLRKSAFKYPDTVKADINFGGSLSEGELVTFGALLGARFPRDLAMKLLQAMRAEAASYKCMS